MTRPDLDVLEFVWKADHRPITLISSSSSRSAEDLIPLATFLASLYGGHISWLHHHKGNLFAGISSYAPIRLGKAIIDCWNYVDGGSNVEVYDDSYQDPILVNEAYPSEKALFSC